MCDGGQCLLLKGSQGGKVVSTHNNKWTNGKITHSHRVLYVSPICACCIPLGGLW